MAITTLSGILSGINQTAHIAKANPGNLGLTGTLAFVDFWSIAGSPGVGAYDTTINGVTLSGGPNYSNNVAGQIPYKDPASGNGYVARIEVTVSPTGGSANNIGGGLWLCDRLWHNQVSNTGTSAQAIVTPTWPSRDINGATSGDGVFILLVNQTGSGGSVANVSISYTNSSGTAGRTGNLMGFVGPSALKAAYEFDLQTGDTGVKSVESFTWGTAPTVGTWNLVAYRPISKLSTQFGFKTYSYDAVQLGFPQVFNGSVLFYLFDDRAQSANGVNGITGHITFAQG